MRKKKSVENIIAVKTRMANYYSFEISSKRFSQLETAFKNVDDNELLKYLPIAIVAIIEAYYKTLIKEIVDSGLPYSQNAIEKLLDNNFKKDELISVYHKIITLGDLISHSLSINGFDSINNIMSNLLNCDFKEEISKISDLTESKFSGKKQEPIIRNINETLDQLAKIYEIRHELCHEPGFNVPIDKVELINAFSNIKSLAKATEELVNFKIHPNRPITQFEINEENRKIYQESEEKLLTIENKIKELLPPSDVKQLVSVQSKWRKFREADSNFFSREEVGGTIWFCIFYSRLKEITDVRIGILE